MPDSDTNSEALTEFTTVERIKLRQILSEPVLPWWQNYPLLIAGAGFLLSLITSAVSIYSGHLKDIHEQQAQLSSTVESFQDLVLKKADVSERYKTDPVAGQPLINLITSQEATVLQIGADLAERLGTSATTAELTTIAEGLYQITDLSRSRRILLLAMAAARNANDEALALWDLGSYDIRSGGSSIIQREGDGLFIRSTKLDEKYDLSSLPEVVAYLKVVGNLRWGAAYARSDCATARVHFADGVSLLNSAPHAGDFELIRTQVAHSMVGGIGDVGSCKPGN